MNSCIYAEGSQLELLLYQAHCLCDSLQWSRYHCVTSIVPGMRTQPSGNDNTVYKSQTRRGNTSAGNKKYVRIVWRVSDIVSHHIDFLSLLSKIIHFQIFIIHCVFVMSFLLKI